MNEEVGGATSVKEEGLVGPGEGRRSRKKSFCINVKRKCEVLCIKKAKILLHK